MRTLIANWKMNLPPAGIDAFLAGIASLPSTNLEVGIAPPHPYLLPVAAEIRRSGSGLLLGGQDCSPHRSGAYTGETAPAMLADCGARFVILGHSERRAWHAESDELVGRKVRAALDAGLRPILCVGEPLEVRESGGTVALLERQLSGALAGMGAPPPHLLVAYEPVWAIGTGRTATPAMAAEAHAEIRRVLAGSGVQAAVLYGGSVKPDNAAQLGAEREIEGFLVGGASLDAGSFRGIGAGLG